MTLEAPKPDSTPSQPHPSPLPTENLLHQPHWPSHCVFSTPHNPHALPLILQALECSSLPHPSTCSFLPGNLCYKTQGKWCRLSDQSELVISSVSPQEAL